MIQKQDVRGRPGIHIAHLNVRSLVNKWETFKIQFMSSNLHFIGLSETWLNYLMRCLNFRKSIPLSVTIGTGRRLTLENLKKEGVLLPIIKNDLQFSTTDFSHCNSSSKDIESQWITITFPNNW